MEKAVTAMWYSMDKMMAGMGVDMSGADIVPAVHRVCIHLTRDLEQITAVLETRTGLVALVGAMITVVTNTTTAERVTSVVTGIRTASWKC